MIGYVFGGVFLLVLAITLVIGIRNPLVYRFRRALIDKSSALGDVEIHSGDFTSWRARHLVFDTVSYTAMVFQFWRPLRSFYRGTILEDLVKDL